MIEHVILIGPQGSGKGTQSKRVQSRLNLASVATGELFRAAIKGGSVLGQQIKAIYDRGELIPDELTVALVDERLNTIATDHHVEGALYDGFPRTSGQADALDRLLALRGEEITAVVAIDVPRDTLIERLAGRRVCAVCGRIYNVVSDPPKSEGRCDDDGGELIQRADDTVEAVAKRLDLYDIETSPLVNRYALRDMLVRVNGDRAIHEVTDAIVSAIQHHATLSPARGR